MDQNSLENGQSQINTGVNVAKAGSTAEETMIFRYIYMLETSTRRFFNHCSNKTRLYIYRPIQEYTIQMVINYVDGYNESVNLQRKLDCMRKVRNYVQAVEYEYKILTDFHNISEGAYYELYKTCLSNLERNLDNFIKHIENMISKNKK